jgi:carbon starvation protein CstA
MVVVNALKDSPWGTFTIAATMPIAVFMGLYLRYWRPGKVGEASLIGFVLIVAAVFGGQAVAQSAALAPWFTLSGKQLAACLIGYGFLASSLPVWLLLAPRDYLSTFVKLGVVILLAVASSCCAGPAAPAADALHRWDGSHLRRKDFPLLLHYDRLRGCLRIPFADFLGNDA